MGSVDARPRRVPPAAVEPRPRRPRRVAGTAGLVLAALLAAAPAQAGPIAPADPHSPTGPGGAWAGYSMGAPARHAMPHQPGGLTGVDVSGHQGAVDWAGARAGGAQFAYVKATEGNAVQSDQFSPQYRGAKATGLAHGAYHFALPDRSTGAAQAEYFLAHGGHWAPGKHALPGALDIERNPYGDPCYGMNPQAMSAWIADFSNTYAHRTGRFPIIYTTTSWWNQCTGANPDFARQNPLWIARYGPDTGPLPAGWTTHTLWQFADQGPLPGDQNSFNGPVEELAKLTA